MKIMKIWRLALGLWPSHLTLHRCSGASRSSLQRTIITSIIVLLTFASCGSSEPEWADPEAHEKTEQLRKQYEPLMVGT